jgi:adenylate cyclase
LKGSIAQDDLTATRRVILVVDLVESVRLMQTHEAQVIGLWRQFVAEIAHLVPSSYGGRVVKHLGDGMLLEFASVKHALDAAFETHEVMARLGQSAAESLVLQLRAGLHVGEVRIDLSDIFGHSVNLAARLAGLAQPGEVVVSAEIRDELVPGLHANFEDLGECWLKHIDLPVRAHRAWPAQPGAQGAQPRALPQRQAQAQAQALLPRLAVLDLVTDAGDELLGGLVADELACALTVNPAVELVSRMSTRGRAGQGQSGEQLLRHVKASYGLSGSCVRLGSQALLSLELLDVHSNAAVWSCVERLEVTDLIQSPGPLLRELCQAALDAASVHEARRARTLPIASLESYALLSGGITLMHRLSRTGFDRGRELLEAVAERTPRHPDAHAWLSRWHLMRAFQGWSDDAGKSTSRASEAARKALDLDDHCSLALTVAGMVQTYAHHRLDEGERLYREALACNPNDALAWLLKGTLHGFRGEGEQALADTRRALALSPVDPQQYYYDALAASAAVSAGHYGEAVELALRSLRANSQHASTLRVLAIAQVMQSEEASARAHVERMLVLEPGFTVTRFLQRAPGAEFPIGRTFAEALKRAGVRRNCEERT